MLTFTQSRDSWTILNDGMFKYFIILLYKQALRSANHNALEARNNAQSAQKKYAEEASKVSVLFNYLQYFLFEFVVYTILFFNYSLRIISRKEQILPKIQLAI